jgi:Fic family protein
MNERINRHMLEDSPCGSLVPIAQGQLAFVPAPLPRSIALDGRLVYLMDEASRAVATLEGVGETLPNPDLLIQPFLRREAVLSSSIEGTQTLLSDLLIYEASNEAQDRKGDAREVLNYVDALRHGLARLHDLPISTRLVNEMHSVLMRDVRGGQAEPGELRTRQVYIGVPNSRVELARYIPPPATYVTDLLSDWERFVNVEAPEMPPLVEAALMHYQFEAIHPYLDGNGRLGRLLIVLHLAAREVLRTPLLYLSGYFERHREEYMDHLLRISVTGDWAPWLAFFLTAVREQARDALARSRKVRELHTSYRERLVTRSDPGNALRLLDQLFVTPIATPSQTAMALGITRAGARGLLDRFVRAGVLEVLMSVRPRFYMARELVEVIDAPTA